MKIFAESKPVISVPFIHLGYLAASYVHPHEGLLLMTKILAIAGIGMIIKFRKTANAALGVLVLLAAVVCFFVSREYGTRYYPHGEQMTAIKMRDIFYRIEDMQEHASGKVAEESGLNEYYDPIKNLPSEAGEYDPFDFVQDSEERLRFIDGWKVPMKMKVVVTEEQKLEYVLMSAGEDRTWNTEDDFTSHKFADVWAE